MDPQDKLIGEASDLAVRTLGSNVEIDSTADYDVYNDDDVYNRLLTVNEARELIALLQAAIAHIEGEQA